MDLTMNEKIILCELIREKLKELDEANQEPWKSLVEECKEKYIKLLNKLEGGNENE